MTVYEIPGYAEVKVPDGGRWWVIYHDGDEEATVRRDGAFLRLGSTSADWQIASSASPPAGIPEATELPA